MGEVTTLDLDIHVKSDSDVEGAAEVTAPPPAVASTSGQQEMDRSVTESELNTSEVTFKAGDMQTYVRAAKPDSPKTPRKSSRTSLFNLTDSNIEYPDTQTDTQETQEPNMYVADTEYTECTEPSKSLGWPPSKDLKGTGFSHPDEPSQYVTMAATSQEQPTPSEDEPRIEKRRGSVLPVIDPDSGRSKDDPESVVPAHVVRNLEKKMSKASKTRSKSTCSKAPPKN